MYMRAWKTVSNTLRSLWKISSSSSGCRAKTQTAPKFGVCRMFSWFRFRSLSTKIRNSMRCLFSATKTMRACVSGSTKRVGIYIGVSRHAQSSWPAFMPEKGSAAFTGMTLRVLRPRLCSGWRRTENCLRSAALIVRPRIRSVLAFCMQGIFLRSISVSSWSTLSTTTATIPA